MLGDAERCTTTSTRVAALICCASALLSACADGSGSESWDGTVLLTEAGPTECSIVFEPTGVQLVGTVDGAVPDPGPSIARGPEGRYFTSTSGGSEVAVWSPEGEFLHRFGRSGDGPGELGRFFGLLAGDDGVLHVVEPGRWSRFSSDGAYLDSRSTASVGSIQIFEMLRLGDGSLIVQPVAEGTDPFVVVSEDGAVEASFGAVDAPDPEESEGFGAVSVSLARSTTRASPDRFWAAPPGGSATGYTLEEWRRDGELLRTLQRQPPWFPAEAPPTIGLHMDGQSRLLSRVVVSDGDAREARYDLIDLETPRILASATRTGANASSPSRFFPGTRLGYSTMRDDLGLSTVAIFRYRVLGADGSPSRECDGGSGAATP